MTDHARGKFVRARFFRSQFGSDDCSNVAKYVIVVEVPSMAEHSDHDADPEFQAFDRLADQYQPEAPLVYGGDLLYSIGQLASQPAQQARGSTGGRGS